MPRKTGAFIVRYKLHDPDVELQWSLPTVSPDAPKLSYAEQCAVYLEAHPDVYDRLLNLALLDAQAGRTVRVKRHIESLRPELGGFDNNLTAPLTDLLNQHPELHGHIAMRARRAE